MKSLREIIPANIVNLRKQKQMTQMDLAKKINYSDKAVSRWEKGEVLPDIETLQVLSGVFNVPLSYLIEEHTDESNRNFKARTKTNEILFYVLMICAVWTLITVVYVYAKIFIKSNPWQIFVWGVPLNCVVMLIYNLKHKIKAINIVFSTLLNWSFLACIYLSFLSQNLWLIFLVGIPIQASIIVMSFTKKRLKNV